MSKVNAYKAGLDRNAANYTPLSPLSLLARSAYVYPSRTAVIHGERRLSWSEVYARCRRLASALRKAGVGAGDTVATMLPNVPAMYEAHFGIPMAGGVINTLNTRLDADGDRKPHQHRTPRQDEAQHGIEQDAVDDVRGGVPVEHLLRELRRPDVSDPQPDRAAVADPDPAHEMQGECLNCHNGDDRHPRDVGRRRAQDPDLWLALWRCRALRL